MNDNVKHIVKLIALVICICLLIWICYLLISLKTVTDEQINTKVEIKLPKVEKVKPFKPIFKKEPVPSEEEQEKILKPFTRDENDVPKSDVNVPEIG